jgi:hypothetical protein
MSKYYFEVLHKIVSYLVGYYPTGFTLLVKLPTGLMQRYKQIKKRSISINCLMPDAKFLNFEFSKSKTYKHQQHLCLLLKL